MKNTARTVHQVATDALNELVVCKETLQQLESTLWLLKKSTPGHSHESRLAALGAHVACDIANHIDGSIERLEAELDATGGVQ